MAVWSSSATLVTYEGEDAKSLKRAFCEAVEDYLGLCEEQGRKPRRTAQGQLQRPPGTGASHRRAMLYARREGMSLNAVVTDALRRMLEGGGRAA